MKMNGRYNNPAINRDIIIFKYLTVHTIMQKQCFLNISAWESIYIRRPGHT